MKRYAPVDTDNGDIKMIETELGRWYAHEDVAPLIEESRWRDVDEEKPPASGYIVVPLLVFCEEINTKRPLIGWVENDLWHIEHKVGKYRVTHWRPLPKLPEKL